MQIFVKISSNSFVIDCKVGDSIDYVIIQAFRKYFSRYNISFQKVFQVNNSNILRMSRFYINNKHVKFGSDILVSKDMDEMTLSHCYLGGSNSTSFSRKDIDYIIRLISLPKL